MMYIIGKSSKSNNQTRNETMTNLNIQIAELRIVEALESGNFESERWVEHCCTVNGVHSHDFDIAMEGMLNSGKVIANKTYSETEIKMVA